MFNTAKRALEFVAVTNQPQDDHAYRKGPMVVIPEVYNGFSLWSETRGLYMFGLGIAFNHYRRVRFGRASRVIRFQWEV